MNEANLINQKYGKWFKSIVRSALQDVNQPSNQKTVLFVTVTFEREGQGRQRRQAEGQSLGEMELNVFGDLYNRLCRKIIGRNYHRQSHKASLPKAIAFIDAEGSRFWRSAGDFNNLHVHSLWVVPKADVGMFNNSMQEIVGSQKKALHIDAVDVQELETDDVLSIDRVTGYSSKMIGFNHKELWVAEDFRVYPTGTVAISA